MSLGAETDHPARFHRPELCQPLGRSGGDPLIDLDEHGLLLTDNDFGGEHVPFLESPVVCQGILVLLVPPEGGRVTFLLGDSRFLGDVLRGLHHFQACVRISIEVVHHPVFGDDLSSRAEGIGPDRVGPVGAAVGHEGIGAIVGTRLDVQRCEVDAGGRGGAGLVDHERRQRFGVVHQHGGRPGVAVKHVKLGNGDAVVHVFENGGVKVLLEKPVPCRLCAQGDGVLVGHASLPPADRG